MESPENIVNIICPHKTLLNFSQYFYWGNTNHSRLFVAKTIFIAALLNISGGQIWFILDFNPASIQWNAQGSIFN